MTLPDSGYAVKIYLILKIFIEINLDYHRLIIDLFDFQLSDLLSTSIPQNGKK